MDYENIITKLENKEELTKEEELAAQLALVHLPIPFRTRDNVIKHLRKVFQIPKKIDEVKKARLAIKYAFRVIARKPKKVTEIADAIRRDSPDTPDGVAYAQAWETYCSYVNPSYEGCTSKGKSKRKSPKSDRM
jgi:hypothetical protein